MGRKKTLVEDLVDITVAAGIGGAAINVIEGSDIPGPLKSGTGSLIGAGLLKGAADVVEKRSKDLEL